MGKQTDKQRIVALQKALRIARITMERCQYEGYRSFVTDALDEINKLDWNSKPDLVQQPWPSPHRSIDRSGG